MNQQHGRYAEEPGRGRRDTGPWDEEGRGISNRDNSRSRRAQGFDDSEGWRDDQGRDIDNERYDDEQTWRVGRGREFEPESSGRGYGYGGTDRASRFSGREDAQRDFEGRGRGQQHFGQRSQYGAGPQAGGPGYGPPQRSSGGSERDADRYGREQRGMDDGPMGHDLSERSSRLMQDFESGQGRGADRSGGFRPSFGQGSGSASGAGAAQSGSRMRGYSGRGPKDYHRSDERIREEISDRMTDDDELDASEISIQVQKGEVTLSGTVSDREQKRRAEDLAESISGVKDVTNSIRVQRDPNGTGRGSSATGATASATGSASGLKSKGTSTGA